MALNKVKRMKMMMFFGSLCGIAYQASLQQEVPLVKGVFVLIYLLLKEEQSLDYGLGFMLGKHLLDLVVLLEEQGVAAAYGPRL